MSSTSAYNLTSLQAIGPHAPVIQHTVSSQFASAVATTLFYPLDLVRTRFMSQDGSTQRQHNNRTYTSIFRAFRVIAQEEGVRQLFRGCSVAVGGSVVAWGLYMYLYRALCNFTEQTSYASRSAISIACSMLSSLLTSPIFLVKSRMQLEEVARNTTYRTLRGSVQHMVRTSGVRSLWRGVSMQLLLVFPNALSIPTYDFLKRNLLQWQDKSLTTRDLSVVEVCLCSTLAKLFVLVLAHPLMTTRVRMQDQRAAAASMHYHRPLQSMSTILRVNGVRGLYRGFSAGMMHTFPRSLVHFIVYEKTLTYLCHHGHLFSGHTRRSQS